MCCTSLYQISHTRSRTDPFPHKNPQNARVKKYISRLMEQVLESISLALHTSQPNETTTQSYYITVKPAGVCRGVHMLWFFFSSYFFLTNGNDGGAAVE